MEKVQIIFTRPDGTVDAMEIRTGRWLVHILYSQNGIEIERGVSLGWAWSYRALTDTLVPEYAADAVKEVTREMRAGNFNEVVRELHRLVGPKTEPWGPRPIERKEPNG